MWEISYALRCEALHALFAGVCSLPFLALLWWTLTTRLRGSFKLTTLDFYILLSAFWGYAVLSHLLADYCGLGF